MRLSSVQLAAIDLYLNDLRAELADPETGHVNEDQKSVFIARFAAWLQTQPSLIDFQRIAILLRRDNVERRYLPRNDAGELEFAMECVIPLDLTGARTIKSERVRRADLAEHIQMHTERIQQQIDAHIRDHRWHTGQLSLFRDDEQHWPDVQGREGK